MLSLQDYRNLLNRRFLNNAFPVPPTNQFNMGTLAPPFELLNAATKEKVRLLDYVGKRAISKPAGRKAVGLQPATKSAEELGTVETPAVSESQLAIPEPESRPKQPILLCFTRIFTEKVYCPLCHPHIMALNQQYEEFVARGTEVLMITSTDLVQTQTVIQDLGLKMPVLSDPTCRTFRLYQVGQALGAPLPAQFLIDSAGRMRFRHLFSFLEPNASVERLLVAVDRLKPQPEAIATTPQPKVQTATG
ncbi:redoxin domain-containing protein [Leptolyngbya sp. AN02str]|uniref:redoxin domain-containing protein n=1 Tax=Leptolyngbya sp. AN02str TaxID=3423363 RepID=UPI003D324167